MKIFAPPIWALFSLLFGAIVFWSPDIILHWSGYQENRFLLLLNSFFTVALTLWTLRRLARALEPVHGGLVVPFALAGIWLACGPVCALNASFSGGTFASLSWIELPPMSFLLSAWDGSIVSLLIVSVYLLLVIRRRLLGSVTH
jgi:hypothetical protein